MSRGNFFFFFFFGTRRLEEPSRAARIFPDMLAFPARVAGE